MSEERQATLQLSEEVRAHLVDVLTAWIKLVAQASEDGGSDFGARGLPQQDDRRSQARAPRPRTCEGE